MAGTSNRDRGSRQTPSFPTCRRELCPQVCPPPGAPHPRGLPHRHDARLVQPLPGCLQRPTNHCSNGPTHPPIGQPLARSLARSPSVSPVLPAPFFRYVNDDGKHLYFSTVSNNWLVGPELGGTEAGLMSAGRNNAGVCPCSVEGWLDWNLNQVAFVPLPTLTAVCAVRPSCCAAVVFRVPQRDGCIADGRIRQSGFPGEYS